ncbi:hypothetical protein Taro_030505 [Colocasia esculenta]|uniref:Uncharacterized protein n=1 Tax=Colocasia esculenta TaxID=4460 RepID=A0A843W0E5_COLES|nr:hypothetical protein [Colocasia esculenta]
MTEAKTEEQWARSNNDLYSQFRRVQAARYPPREAPLPLSKQYLQGHIKADVLAPILSECERLSPEEWTKLYPLSAQQLGDLNASQASSNHPPLSPNEFLDANSLHLIRDSYLTWVERYKVFFALKKELRSLQLAYPLKIEAFLRFASFGSFLTFKLALGSVKKTWWGIQGVVVPFCCEGRPSGVSRVV